MIETAIDRLLAKLQHKGLMTQRVQIYAIHVKGKFHQVRWSIDVLREIERKPNIKVNTTSEGAWDRMSIEDKVQFFCECFWDFLRSSIDIMAQLINELHPSGIDEDKVDFKTVLDKMRQSPAVTTPLYKALVSCARSSVFEELNSYRRCSTHRRQVCIFHDESVSTSTTTKGYTYMGGEKTTIVNRYLCSNPLSLHPRKSLKRPVLAHNENILKTIEKRLCTIINRLP